MTDILRAVSDSRAVGQKGWTEDDVRYAISFTFRDRDKAWREAVERVRSQGCGCGCDADDMAVQHNTALDALLAAMEGK